MAEVVEHELMENVCNLKSYIKDTTELLRKLNKIPQPLPGNSIMFCLDVKALYPSVPRKEARIACEKALQKRQKPSIPTVCVLNMLDLVLENNHFGFNEGHSNRIPPRNELCMHIFRGMGTGIVRKK